MDRVLDELLEQLSAVMLVGPRACGKTTLAARRAATVVRLDSEVEAAAFAANADAALRAVREPVLLDEWQAVPAVFGAARRAVDDDPRPNRFYLTGSVRAELENEVWPGTGRFVRLPLFPMTVRERVGKVEAKSFFDKLADGDGLSVPANSPDLIGYVDLAVESGFPRPALQLSGRARGLWLQSYVADLLTHDIEGITSSQTRRRDRERLRRYFEAYALSSAGVVEHKTIFEAAGVSKATGAEYEALLSRLFVVDQLPAWSSNRLKRLRRTPKRYMIDAALIATTLRLTAQDVLRHGDMLGRVLDTFVVSQLRPEAVVAQCEPRLYHLRTERGRHEIDVVAELGGHRVLAVEVKAAAAPSRADARHLAWLRDELGDRFVAGVVLHTGPRIYELSDRIVAAPISTLWG